MYIDDIHAGDSYIDSSAEAVVYVERQGCLPNSHCAGAAGGEQGIRRATSTALARAPTPVTPSYTTKTKQLKQPRRSLLQLPESLESLNYQTFVISRVY